MEDLILSWNGEIATRRIRLVFLDVTKFFLKFDPKDSSNSSCDGIVDEMLLEKQS